MLCFLVGLLSTVWDQAGSPILALRGTRSVIRGRLCPALLSCGCFDLMHRTACCNALTRSDSRCERCRATGVPHGGTEGRRDAQPVRAGLVPAQSRAQRVAAADRGCPGTSADDLGAAARHKARGALHMARSGQSLPSRSSQKEALQGSITFAQSCFDPGQFWPPFGTTATEFRNRGGWGVLHPLSSRRVMPAAPTPSGSMQDDPMSQRFGSRASTLGRCFGTTQPRPVNFEQRFWGRSPMLSRLGPTYVEFARVWLNPGPLRANLGPELHTLRPDSFKVGRSRRMGSNAA